MARGLNAMEDEILDVPAEAGNMETLYETLEMVSNEAQFIGNFVNYFNRKSANITVGIKEGFKYLTTYNYSPMETLNPVQTKFFLSSGIEYLDLKDFVGAKPFGLRVEMLPYTTELVKRVSLMTAVIDVLVKETTSTVANFVNNPTLRSERRFQSKAKMAVDLESIKREESKFFGTTRQAEEKFQSLYNSFNDFIQCENNLVDIRRDLKEGRLVELKTSLENLVALTSTLLEQAGQTPFDEREKPSKEFTEFVSSELLQAAKWTEWYALQMTRIIETNNCLALTEKELRSL